MAKYTVHAGHAKDGNRFSGAVGFCKESTVARIIKNELIKKIKELGDTAVDITVQEGESQSDIVKKQYRKANSVKNVSANISLHLNAYKKVEEDDKVKGTEIWLYSTESDLKKEARQILANMKELGFTNRGIKYCTTANRSIGFLKNTDKPSMLIELFFCDDEDDFLLYKEVGKSKIAEAIAYGMNCKRVAEDIEKEEKIAVGDTVKIEDQEAVYGGAAAGKKIPDSVQKKTHTVKKIQKNNGKEEALLKEINSWVAVKYLSKVL